MRIAALQMTTNHVVADNLATAKRLIGQATAAGARLVLLPEYWCQLGLNEGDKLAIAEAAGKGPLQDFLASAAVQHGIFLAGGSIPLFADSAHVFNSTLVFDPEGQQVARYDKVHLFNFDNGSEAYNESRTIKAGKGPGSFTIKDREEVFRVGTAICFDLRFPEFFRALGDIDVWLLPAAFTATTGAAHWEVLLRARAIENQSYFLASAQSGLHSNGRRTFGHSCLIDPWGRVVAQQAEGEGIVLGDVSRTVLSQVRTQLPALKLRVMA